ncbi:hypothetical protein BAUCODRAFT_122446 [Baudoinia panamericana UAMH 10762]|uniref:Uncharacterized protein n=1 Tax=Baudoinia panamericana (strain UAMH 10762) TaxID=717646 RepID=M2LPW2_BAUPA|nr:uncharacterized protein BAUCODRAFT_122446 [Baudoinia panamericana UAMH 10762]EMC96442.1 hypothetical protein BAUCODRAFT_122446 [Baudoinia panamericana UAMH 10762]
MGFSDIFKVVLLPALIAAAIYVSLAYILVPLYRQHRARYSQYLPLDTISAQTSTLRSRLSDALTRMILPSSMRWRGEVVVDARAGEDELAFGEEEGESMVGFNVTRMQRGRDEMGGRVADELDSQRRLSLELEQGFKDDSEEDDDTRDGRRR